MKKTILLSVMSAAILAMGTASAGGGSLFGGSSSSSSLSSSSSSESSSMLGGLYVGGSYGLATTNCMIHDALGFSKDCETSGWKAFAGYNISDMFAIEGGYYFLGESDESVTGPFTYNNVTYQSATAVGEASGLGLSGVVKYNVLDSVGVFGKLGAISYTSEGTITSTDINNTTYTNDKTVDGVSLLWGVGGNYQLTDNIGVRGEYEGFTREDVQGNDQDVSIMSLGATFSTY